MSQDKEGWVYCISNENVRSAKLPNNILLKIGMTERTPQERLAEANKSDIAFTRAILSLPLLGVYSEMGIPICLNS